MIGHLVRNIIFLIIFIDILNGHKIMAFRLKATKMKCNATDTTFVEFKTCRVKAESRDVQYYTVYLKYLQLPIEQVKVRYRFLKRANGYKPFLYDFTLKCDFIKHLNPLTTLLWTWFKTVSNLNHTCPFTEDFEIKRLENRYLQQQLSALPLISGDYALFVNFTTENVSRFTAEFYATIY